MIKYNRNMNMKKLGLITAVLGSAVLAGCAGSGSPVVYKKDMNQQQANQDIQQCEMMASQNAKKSTNKQDAKNAAKRSAGGAAIGGMLGAASGGDGLKSAGLGAAAGASTSILGKIFEGDSLTPEYKSFVSSCLRDRGYQVQGWQ